MNFPPTQRTGALAEMAVTQLFMSWSWNVGQDRIDMGYDLFIAPTHETYKGGRFLVQVKGTTKKADTKSISTSISKNRLRQYAESSIPVFIIRATSDGQLYWLHAQEWARQSESRIMGQGYINVTFEKNKTLSNRQNFEEYLRPLLIVHNSKGTKHTLPASLHSSIFTENPKNKTSDIELNLPESLLAELSFIPNKNPQNLDQLKDILFFGLPGKVFVESFNIKGLPLPENLSGNFGKGEITLTPVDSNPGKIRLIPGQKRAITSTELILDAEAFSGYKGFAITNERKFSTLDLCIRILLDESFHCEPKARFSFRTASFPEKPIRDIDELSQIYLWTEQALKHQGFILELEFSEQRISLPFPQESYKTAVDFLYLAHILGKIHLIARTTNSPLRIPTEFSLSREDLRDIDTAYSLLRGDKQQTLTGFSMKLTPNNEINSSRKISLFGRKMLTFKLFDQELCKIPARFDLDDFKVENIPNSTEVLITPSDNSKAWISFAEDYSDDLESAWFSPESVT